MNDGVSVVTNLKKWYDGAGKPLDKDGKPMQKTAGLTDKIILFSCCLMILLYQSGFGIDVVIVLVSVIISSLLSFFDSDRIKIAITAGYLVLIHFIPSFIVFLPLIVFDTLFSKYQYINLIGLIPLITAFQTSFTATLTVSAILPLSALLRYRLKERLDMAEKYDRLIDSTREMSIQLKNQNRELIEKQDYEVNVAMLNERNRIAREIHDNVGHLLSSALLQSGALMTINRDEKIADGLERLKDTLDQAMSSIRSSVHELYDDSLDLKARIMKLAEKFTFCKLSCDFQINSNPDRAIKYAFVSIVKEALSNIIRHSDATEASILLREHPALYQLIIRDNGNIKRRFTGKGLGLQNMTDRVEALGGNINIITENGFEIFASVPKEDAYEAAGSR